MRQGIREKAAAKDEIRWSDWWWWSEKENRLGDAIERGLRGEREGRERERERERERKREDHSL